MTFTPRVTRPANPDGTPKPYPQRAADRRAADSARRRDERDRKAQAAREAQFAPPPPKPPTAEQRKAARVAEAEGKRLAEARAAQRQVVTEPVNPYRQRAAEYADQAYRPDSKRRAEYFNRLADQWDREREAEAKAEAERQRIATDPAVINALENWGFAQKLAGPEQQAELVEIGELAKAGLVADYWQRMREFEQRQWALEDKRKAELAASRAESDAAFLEASAKVDATKARLEAAEAQTVVVSDSPAE